MTSHCFHHFYGNRIFFCDGDHCRRCTPWAVLWSRQRGPCENQRFHDGFNWIPGRADVLCFSNIRASPRRMAQNYVLPMGFAVFPETVFSFACGHFFDTHGCLPHMDDVGRVELEHVIHRENVEVFIL